MSLKTRAYLRENRVAAPGLALLAIVVLAALARSVGLNGGLWIDEIYSLVRSFRAPLPEILTEFWGDNHHPLYAVLAHASRALFGESPWAVRLPAMLFGVAAVPMLYALGMRVTARREALLAALLLAVSYHHVWFSQNARGYSAIAFFALVTMWALLRGTESGRMRYFVLYAVAAALGAYTHLTMIFVVVGHALAALALLAMSGTRDERWALARGGTVAFGLGALLTLSLYAPMLRAVLDFFLQRPSQLRGVSTPAWALVEGLRVLVLGLGAGVAVVGAAVVLAGAFVGAGGLVSFWGRNRLFVLMLVGPAVVTIAGAAAARGTMYPRFFFFAIGPAMLIAVRGAYAAAGWAGARAGRDALAEQLATWGVRVVIVLSAASLAFNYRYPKQDFEGAMQYVLAQRDAGDRVVSTGLPADPYSTLYGQSWPNVTTREALDSLRSSGGRTWVLWTFPRYLVQAAPDIDRLLREQCPQPSRFRGTVGDGDVLVCALDPITRPVAAPVTAPAAVRDLRMVQSK
ncbi:MAG: glycosyltransferase family 39 protein [Gemmatimonadaceae bacterium]